MNLSERRSVSIQPFKLSFPRKNIFRNLLVEPSEYCERFFKETPPRLSELSCVHASSLRKVVAIPGLY